MKRRKSISMLLLCTVLCFMLSGCCYSTEPKSSIADKINLTRNNYASVLIGVCSNDETNIELMIHTLHQLIKSNEE